ncbi:MAG: hypothetical protein HQK81_14005 [Desulfovibrionaceae bacterium]|nr:hypothetical protein [Desulfovibrionaceae bacterium]MBF0515157.1 hypothetical protein [Desulfovibrionaceae bacterium]
MSIIPPEAISRASADRRIRVFFSQICFGLAIFELILSMASLVRALTGATHFSPQGTIAPLFFAGVLLFLRSRRTKAGTEISLLAVFFLFGLMLVDGVLDYTSRPHRNLSYSREQRAKELGIPYDNRGIPKVVTMLRDDGVNAYPHIAPSFLVGRDHEPLYPMGGISGKTIVFCNESGKFSVYPSDRHGFNNPPESWDHGAVGSLVIGDSFANGACVQPGEDIASRLRAQGISSVTLGMWGNGPLIELGSLVEYAPTLRPKTVFWLFYENDLDRLVNEAEDPLLRRYLDPAFSQHLIDRQDAIDAYLIDTVRSMYREKGIDLSRPAAEAPVHYQLAGIDFDWKQMGLNLDHCIQIASLQQLRTFVENILVYKHSGATTGLFKQVLARAKSVVGAWGGAIYLVYLPEYYRFAPISPLARLEYRRLHDAATMAARDNGIEVIDILDIFNSQPDPIGLFPLRMYGHYTAETYDLIAKVLVNRLER